MALPQRFKEHKSHDFQKWRRLVSKSFTYEFCGLFFKGAMNVGFEMTLLMVSSPLIWAKLTFVALTNHESFRDTTGYVTVNTSRQRSTIDFSLSIQSYSSVVPSNLILRIRLPQSHCYYTLHIHPNSSNIRCSIDRHSLPRHNR